MTVGSTPLSELSPAERHRAVAATFTERVLGAQAAGRWEAPTPVTEWSARDVVAHLTSWLPGFLGGAGVQLPGLDGAAPEDPVAAWRRQADAVQAVLDDPAGRDRIIATPMGEQSVAATIDSFYTNDVFMHTWDLARATGQDDRLDEGMCIALLGMEQAEEAIRASGQFGVRQPVPADADPQTRLIAFIGRDPNWTPPAAPQAASRR